MELKDQVCSLEQAKKLFELIPNSPHSIFDWILWDDNEHFALVIEGYYNEDAPDYEPVAHMGDIHESYPAYTVAELSEMLPVNQWASFKYSSNGEIGYTSSYWADKKLSTSFNDTAYEVHEPTQAQSAATMLIYLLTNNLHNL